MEEADLRDLHAFAAVARLRNFRRAALEQRMSVSSLSQRLRDLEERLGVRLLNRTTRSVAATEAGENLLRRIAPALAEIAEAVTEARGRQGVATGRLRINAPAPAAQLVLAPMVAPFLKRHPGIDLEIAVDTSLIDIVAEGYDAGVRFEEHLARDMIAVPLGGPQRYAVVASPEFLAAHGTPTEPEDLLGAPTITTRFRSGAILSWEFERDGRVVRIVTDGPFTCSDIRTQIQAALDGLGFMLTFEGYVTAAVERGRLVRVLDGWNQSFPGPFLYYPSRRQPPAALEAFLAFVREWRRDDRGAKPVLQG
ncbi:LysR family transcriptional regulator [Skermanella stibiiresistens SB22]|uniref:LysR family transcriptional regulator n=1 Tax=Skermanella stibiiresistens SB22 TaxID=1385369 RepID=W9H0D9_9PROT|nr:LysR family transcriptional regulator [Skermanella stibiiresistens]EWY39544.1 LysR family transcriptional regulator [Skermanella stibiiresistens SB22]